jgi:hypothetical protein
MRYRVGRRTGTSVVVLTATLTLLSNASAAAADDEGRDVAARFGLPPVPSASIQTAPQAPSRATADFLFGRPRGWVALRGGWLRPRASGDLFTFVGEQLTVEKGAFNTPAMIGEVGVAITSRIQASGGVEFSRQTVASEYRRFVDNSGDPITQSTMLSQTDVTGSIRIALLDAFSQTGDFVDFATLRVFPDAFRSQGWTPSAHVFGGADIRLWRQLFLDVEGRYVWAHGDLGSDFVGFDGIDLDGFRVSTGVSVVF